MTFLPSLPPEAWPLAVVILLLLGAAAAIDALTGRVPDPIIFIGLLITTGARGFLSDWQSAANYLMMALAAGFLVWGVNQIWYVIKKRDALGMGDGKWTMLAVATFGPLPALAAWFMGAWLALGWMGVMLITHKRIERVHLAPFLFFGLLVGIYFFSMRLKGGM